MASDEILDVSGLTARGLRVEGTNMSYALYNGGVMRDSEFRNCDVSGSELCEADIVDSAFHGCTFESSDFIETRVSGTKFVRCSFKDGEWRESTFSGCEFLECNFVFTTMGLCTFSDCRFDQPSIDSLIGPSKRHNVFLRTEADLREDQLGFLERNIGLTSPHRAASFEPDSSRDRFSVLALKIYVGQARSEDFVTGCIEAASDLSSAESASTLTRLRYVVLATRTFVEAGTISAVSTLYLSERLALESQETTNHDAGMELAGLVVACRRFVLEEIARVEAELDPWGQEALAEGTKGTIFLDETLRGDEARLLTNVLASMCEIPEEAIVLSDIRQGSTIIEIVLTAPVAIAAVVKSVEYLATKGKVFFGSRGRKRVHKRKSPRQKPSTALAVPFGRALGQLGDHPEVRRMARGVRKGGRVVLKFDGKLEVELDLENGIDE